MAKNKNPKIVEVDSFSVRQLKEIFGKGRFGTVVFTKKKDGSVRTLNGKTTVLDAMVGGTEAYDASAYGQVRVCDVNLSDSNGNRTKGYRTVTAQNVISATSNGVKYVVKTPTPVLNFVQKISFDNNTNTLFLQLSGVSYRFFNVARSVYINLISAENKGEFFNKHIRGTYDYARG